MLSPSLFLSLSSGLVAANLNKSTKSTQGKNTCAEPTLTFHVYKIASEWRERSVDILEELFALDSYRFQKLVWSDTRNGLCTFSSFSLSLVTFSFLVCYPQRR